MKTLILTVLFLMAMIVSGTAHGASYDENVQKLYSPELVEAIIKQQMRHKHEVRPIDGNLPAIEISRCTSDCMDLPPTKLQMREKYYGR